MSQRLAVWNLLSGSLSITAELQPSGSALGLPPSPLLRVLYALSHAMYVLVTNIAALPCTSTISKIAAPVDRLSLLHGNCPFAVHSTRVLPPYPSWFSESKFLALCGRHLR
ncbi:hypothetical protein EDB85DRAFT_962659 [Lactarius pseudohatsudake]|nr:hypothetical protein EDB85DRAFT_962659 [Lactarius pseudohatsudake]